MFKIECIDHIVLRTYHIDSMIDFYCNILGCHIEQVQEEIGLTQLRAGTNIIDLVKIEKPLNDSNRNLEHLCLRIYPFDYESLKKYFREKNIEIYRYGNRYGAQGIGPSFYLKDPEGNEIELKATMDNKV